MGTAESERAAPSSAPEPGAEELMAHLYENSGRPLADRAETVRTVHALLDASWRDPLSNVHGAGPLLLSDVPESARQEGVVVGIDEAGRGSVLGPMVYGAAYWHPSVADSIPKDFNDSKQLTEEKRASLLGRILHATPAMGFAIRVLHASEIARNMQRPVPYNLNQMSHDAAIDMIRRLLRGGVRIHTCYIDTVGNPQSYARRLEAEFPGLAFVVESKADAKYPPCSAASVVAKNVRDRMTASWRFSEPGLEATTAFGSGYPSDPTCQQWLEDHLRCRVFGYPDVVRFSWGPVKAALAERAAPAAFEADRDEDDGGGGADPAAAASRKRQQEQMSVFLGRAPAPSKVKRYPYFAKRRIEVVSRWP